MNPAAPSPLPLPCFAEGEESRQRDGRFVARPGLNCGQQAGR